MADQVRVLLVEDGGTARATGILAAAGDTFGVEVVRAARLADAQRVLAGERIDLVVLDLAPAVGIGAAAMRVSEAAPGIPILAFTGAPEDTAIARAVLDLADRLRAARRFEALGLLAGGIAHDVNNVLAVVLGCAERLLARPTTEEGRVRLLEDILAAAEGAAVLTGKLLTFTHTSPRADVPIDVEEVVRSAGTLVRQVVGDDVELVVRLQGGLPGVRTDPADLRQVLLSLADNARDAMPSGGRLEISSGLCCGSPPPGDMPLPGEPGTAPGPYVTLRVRDTGEGITDDVRVRLSEPFFTTKTRDRGTGLGLATAQGVVARAGGTITLDSEPGVGSTVTVYLPAAG